jgi:hypothetical protein
VSPRGSIRRSVSCGRLTGRLVAPACVRASSNALVFSAGRTPALPPPGPR